MAFFVGGCGRIGLGSNISAEDSYIIHYTKAVVTAFGDDDGWDEDLGLKTEIVPLSKPFGLHAGNVFQGIVKLNGRAVCRGRSGIF